MPIGIALFNDQINDNNFKVVFAPTKEEKTFSDYEELRRFINNECEYWQDFTQGILNSIRAHLLSIKSTVDTIEIAENPQDFARHIERLNSLTRNNNLFVRHDSPEVQFIVKLHKINQARGNAAYAIIFNHGVENLNDYERLRGTIEALEFMRLKEEPISEDRANLMYEEIVAKHLGSIKVIKEDYAILKSEFEKELVSNNAKIQSTNQIFTQQTTDQSDSFVKQLTEWREKVKSLEKAYDDLLVLKKPAEYWKALQKDYSKQGSKWIHWAIVTSIISIAFLVFLIFSLPEWLRGDFKIDHLKGLIIFTLVISTLSYLIHLFVKLSTSALHLSRDAEERRQLTFLYLSLLKEGAVQPDQRNIILQALFSRADTGLLKNDGAPAFPNSSTAIEKLLSSIKR